jgi:hypothetical protein
MNNDTQVIMDEIELTPTPGTEVIAPPTAVSTDVPSEDVADVEVTNDPDVPVDAKGRRITARDIMKAQRNRGGKHQFRHVDGDRSKCYGRTESTGFGGRLKSLRPKVDKSAKPKIIIK